VPTSSWNLYRNRLLEYGSVAKICIRGNLCFATCTTWTNQMMTSNNQVTHGMLSRLPATSTQNECGPSDQSSVNVERRINNIHLPRVNTFPPNKHMSHIHSFRTVFYDFPTGFSARYHARSHQICHFTLFQIALPPKQQHRSTTQLRF
jgi:hypothetical protein